MSNNNKKQETMTTLSPDYIIKRLLVLPQMIYDLSCSIEETQHELTCQQNECEMLKNEFQTLQTIARLM